MSDFKTGQGDSIKVRQWLHNQGIGFGHGGLSVLSNHMDCKYIAVRNGIAWTVEGERAKAWFDAAPEPVFNLLGVATKKPSVEWDMRELLHGFVSSAFDGMRYATVNSDGEVWLWPAEPVCKASLWAGSSGAYMLTQVNNKYLIDNWRESLTPLPEPQRNDAMGYGASAYIQAAKAYRADAVRASHRMLNRAGILNSALADGSLAGAPRPITEGATPAPRVTVQASAFNCELCKAAGSVRQNADVLTCDKCGWAYQMPPCTIQIGQPNQGVTPAEREVLAAGRQSGKSAWVTSDGLNDAYRRAYGLPVPAAPTLAEYAHSLVAADLDTRPAFPARAMREQAMPIMLGHGFGGRYDD